MPRARPRRTLSWRLALALAAVATGCGAEALGPTPEVTRLEAGELRVGDEQTSRPVTLPHLWSEQIPAHEGIVRYRFRFPTPEIASETLAVYLPKLNMNARVLVNGAVLGDGGAFTPPVAQNWNRPLYFRFPGRLLGPQQNTLEVQLYAYAHDWGGLFPLYVGPHERLVGAYERQYTLQIVLSQLASVVVLLLALVMGALAIGSRDSVYWYWALGCLLYYVHSLSAHVRDIDMPYPIGRWLIHLCFDLFAVCLAIGMHRWADARHPRRERAVLAVVLTGAAVSLLVPSRYFLPVANTMHVVALLVGAYASTIMVRHFGRLGGPEVRVTIGAGVVALGLGLHALLIYFGVLPQDEPRLLKLMAPVLMLGFGGVLVARYVRSARAAADLNVQLEARVAQREAELRASYERTRQMEKAHLLEEERSRLMREMHDGMGGRLVSLLSLARAGAPQPDELVSALSAALEEMRVIVDSLDPDVAELGALLGLARERLEPRMKSAGLRFEWAVGLLPDGLELTPQQSLDVLRFLQESLTNIMKHAQAEVVKLGTHLDADEVLIFVQDDGRGFDPDAPPGRGLGNLRARAARLGGRCDIDASDSGTQVRLTLPRAALTRPDR